jgi:hypothetical protein
MKHLKSYNESIRDKMTAVPDEDIIKILSKIKDPYDKLYAAVEYGLLSVVKEIIEEHNIDIDRALELALYYNHDDIAKYLLEQGANPNADDGRFMRHPINRNDLSQIKMLLDYGFELNEPGWNHSEMLYIVLRDNKSEEIIDLFLKYGAKVSDSEKLKKAFPKYADVIDKYKK